MLFNRRAIVRLAVVALVAAVLGSVGCRSQELGTTPAIVPPVLPAEPDFSTPQNAVKTYTDWISYAYRVMNSDVATHTFGPEEEVRVNSYVMFNIQERRGLEQNLNESEYAVTQETTTVAKVIGREYWGYRYFALDESKYLTEPLKASYDVTYTVTLQPDGRWLVQSLDVTRLDPLPTSE